MKRKPTLYFWRVEVTCRPYRYGNRFLNILTRSHRIEEAADKAHVYLARNTDKYPGARVINITFAGVIHA